jgi:Tol biopolymer transport system component
MTELKEVFEMVTKQTEPDRDSWKRQEDRQHTRSRNRKAATLGLAAAIVIGLVAVAFVSRPGTEPAIGTHRTTPSPVPLRTTPPIGAQIVGIHGTAVQQLAEMPPGATGLRLSPDGSTVAFMLQGELHTIGVDGTDDRTLAGASGNGNDGDAQDGVSWSPDGTELAFALNGELFVINADGSAVHRITKSPPTQGSYHPAWSPDGSTIVYWRGASSGEDGGPTAGNGEIYTIPAQGGAPTRLTHDGINDLEPAWSPDGSQIAYFHGGELWVMRANGGDQHRLYQGHGDAWAPAWSPDGATIAFLSYDPSERSLSDAPLLKVLTLDLASGSVTDLKIRVETDFNGPSWISNDTLLVNRYD